jgi:hypothetical protein
MTPLKIACFVSIVGMSALVHAAPPVPTNWTEFEKSLAAEDIAIVRRLRKIEWWEACQLWGRSVREVKDARLRVGAREFLLSQRLINGKDLGHVGDRSVDIGMTACGVFAALGRPHTVNQTQTARGHHSQLVYGRLYVYVDGVDANGVVTAIQR